MGTRRAVSFNQAAGRAGCIFTATKAPTVVFNISKKWNFHIAADQNSVDNIEVEFLISRVTRCHRPFDSLTNRFFAFIRNSFNENIWRVQCNKGLVSRAQAVSTPAVFLQLWHRFVLRCLLVVCLLLVCVRSPLFASHNNRTHLCSLPQL